MRAALAASHSANTRRAYTGHWEAFAAWAGRTERTALPAEPETVAAHLAELATRVKPATLKLRRAAIAAAHRADGLPDPTASALVRRTLAGLVRAAAALGEASPKQAPALTAEGLAAVRANARRRRKNRAGRRESAVAAERRGSVDIALCSVMRDGLLRPSEAAALTWADIKQAGDGTGRLALGRSKGDQSGEGTVLYLGEAAMLDLEAIRPEDVDGNARVFGLRCAQSISRRLRDVARQAGLGDSFSGHSARVGMTLDLAADGAELVELMRAGRWKTSAMPARYTRMQAAGRGAVAKYYAKRSD